MHEGSPPYPRVKRPTANKTLHLRTVQGRGRKRIPARPDGASGGKTRSGLVCKAQRRLYHSHLGLGVIKKKGETEAHDEGGELLEEADAEED